MQGLPANLLTQNVGQQTTVKTDSNSSGVVNTKEGQAESKGVFASIFEGLLGLGSDETKVEGEIQNKGEGKSEKNSKGEEAVATKVAVGPEVHLDTLLKNKDQDKNKKTEVQALTPETAMSSEVLKNVNNLIDKTPRVQTSTTEGALGDKVANTSTNLEQLLNTLKGKNDETAIEGEIVDPSMNGQEPKKAKNTSPLDFLLKESKASDVVSSELKEILESNPDAVSKLGLSSEDFLSQMNGSKAAKEKTAAQNILNLDSEFDPRAFGDKQMNQSMKAYGQKQNLLNDNVIRSTKDLAFKDVKSKSTSGIDELKSPEMKIGAEAAIVKEQFIPVMGKQESAQNVQTQGSEKVLDLSKINTSNTNEIIKKISDYIQQGQVANKDSIDLTVRHDSLGEFKIQVNRPMGQANGPMDMQIVTSTAEGHEFFAKHEISLMKNLSQAGIQLSDLRIVSESGSASFAGNDSRQSNNSQNGSLAGKEFMSFDQQAAGDSRHGADRRRELWQEARNNQQRYGA